ncbi:MAG: hypothetical protein HDR88_08380 [Bacteroides sp.]|nr:hypothetical protein [Bacteroides sp.]
MKSSKDKLVTCTSLLSTIKKFYANNHDTILVITTWLVFSPLLLLVRKKVNWSTKGGLWILILFSPFILYILALFVVGVFFISDNIQLYNGYFNANMYPELTQFSRNPFILLLEMLCLPIYAICVAVLFGVMWFTDWSYKAASVYVCEYMAPIICAATAIILIIIMLTKLWKINHYGRLLMLLPISIEAYMVYNSIMTYLERKVTYTGMTIEAIFNYVVNYLIKMGRDSHTNYILANMYVYILPLIIILITGYAGKRIYKNTKRSYSKVNN